MSRKNVETMREAYNAFDRDEALAAADLTE
jgi:hypothetical protein